MRLRLFDRLWQFKFSDFIALVEIVKEQDEKIARLEEIVERQGNQIENAFRLFSKEGEHCL